MLLLGPSGIIVVFFFFVVSQQSGYPKQKTRHYDADEVKVSGNN